eukprot:GHVL01009752.1.p1 GENE.GHVL01009752.1~~GHVL01009752.1.p1  ORF type:complete len:342 (-),score=75.77 GHVL01009752.1:222-1247(-)
MGDSRSLRTQSTGGGSSHAYMDTHLTVKGANHVINSINNTDALNSVNETPMTTVIDSFCQPTASEGSLTRHTQSAIEVVTGDAFKGNIIDPHSKIYSDTALGRMKISHDSEQPNIQIASCDIISKQIILEDDNKICEENDVCITKVSENKQNYIQSENEQNYIQSENEQNYIQSENEEQFTSDDQSGTSTVVDSRHRSTSNKEDKKTYMGNNEISTKKNIYKIQNVVKIHSRSEDNPYSLYDCTESGRFDCMNQNVKHQRRDIQKIYSKNVPKNENIHSINSSPIPFNEEYSEVLNVQCDVQLPSNKSIKTEKNNSKKDKYSECVGQQSDGRKKTEWFLCS